MKKCAITFAGKTVSLIYPSSAEHIIKALFVCQSPEKEDLTHPSVIKVDFNEKTGEFSLPDHKKKGLRKWFTKGEFVQALFEFCSQSLIEEISEGLVLQTSAVSKNGSGIIFPGQPGTGKSTLLPWFIKQKYEFLTDTLVYLPNTSLSMQSFAGPLMLNNLGMEAFDYHSLLQKKKSHLLFGEKICLVPHSLLAKKKLKKDPDLSFIIFSHCVQGANLSVEVLSPAKTGMLLMGCLANAENLPNHGFSPIAGISRKIPAIQLIYGGLEQLEDVLDAIISIVIELRSSQVQFKKVVSPFTKLINSSANQPSVSIKPVPPVYPIPIATSIGEKKKLSIGMATYDDYDGVYFTAQALRLYHPEILDESEIIVIDNHPDGPCGASLKHLDQYIKGYRYIPFKDVAGTAVRNFIFHEANGEYVLSIDCHVLIFPGALKKLIDYLDAHPKSQDLLQGPIMYDDLTRIGTHLDPVWRQGMYGIWATDERGKDLNGQPFDIPMQGLGLFACRKEAWPGFNPRFFGFGGEEGYIHEKFRRNGARVLCLPFLRWLHRFFRPMGIPYSLNWKDRIHNYMIGFKELEMGTEPIKSHFIDLLGEQEAQEIIDSVEKEIKSPFQYFDAIYCICLDSDSKRWEKMQKRFKALGIHERVRLFKAINTPGNTHVGCALSHRAIILSAQRQNLSNVMVFEDDALFLNETLTHLSRCVKELKKQEWNIFYLGGHKWGNKFAKAKCCSYLERPEILTCTHALAYNHTVFNTILKDLPEDPDGMITWLQKHHAIDQYLCKLNNRYLTSPVIASQPSLLAQEEENYRDDFTLGEKLT